MKADMAVPKNKQHADIDNTQTGADLSPILIDLGKARRNRVSKLKRGKGRLLKKVEDAIEQTVKELGNDAKDKVVLPVVVIVEKRPKRQRKISSLIDLAIPGRS
jgi:putative transposon-encoded protein